MRQPVGWITGLKADTPEGEKVLPFNRVLLAIGSRPANRIVSTTTGIDVDESGYVITRERPYGHDHPQRGLCRR